MENHRPKSNFAQIILAACAVITLIVTLLFNCNSEIEAPKVQVGKEEKLSNSNFKPEQKIAKVEQTLHEINSDSCIDLILKEDYFLFGGCTKELIKQKDFKLAISILESAKRQTINSKKIKNINSRINDVEICQKHGFDDARGAFHDKLTITYEGSKKGLVNKKGEILYAPIFQSINPADFSPLIEVKENNKIGFLNSDGEIITSTEFNSADPVTFSPMIIVNKGSLYGFIDRNGAIIHEPKFDDILFEHEGLIGIREYKGKWGFIDTLGNVKIDFKYSKVDDFKNGKAKVRLYDKEFEIDEKGERLSGG